jgi:hypothetical protein
LHRSASPLSCLFQSKGKRAHDYRRAFSAASLVRHGLVRASAVVTWARALTARARTPTPLRKLGEGALASGQPEREASNGAG